ncbi:hypothetical protein F4778DRAFT_760885 [Xylariomycetidae sp. FL2044]|nr:hypothetical protein F4778DRAFT_760885 [Xylariomycetidae sp. FL2044]
MANAQLMQEELQQSVVLSEEDAEFEEDIPEDTMMADASGLVPSTSYIDSARSSEHRHNSHGAVEEQEDSDAEAGGEEELEAEEQDDDVLDEDIDPNQDEEDSGSDVGDAQDDEEAFEVDADGEGDDETTHPPPIEPNDDSSDEEEDEGVGAVKIKPGETDEEDSESESEASEASGGSDSGSAAEWEEAVENEDDEDEEEEAAEPNNCIFCKKDEESDPAEEFEAYLACSACGDHAHQQCARNAAALDHRNGASNWKCPDCAEDNSNSDSEPELPSAAIEDADSKVPGGAEGDELSPTSGRHSSVPKLARDLLPAHRGVDKPDSHSVFNQLVLDEDPMDGSRVLRKRKASSADPEEDVEGLVLRRRRKTTSDESAQDEGHREKVNGSEGSVRPRSARALRLKASNAACTIIKHSRSSLTLRMRVDASELQKIISQKPKSQRKRPGRAGRTPASRSARPTIARNAAAAAAEPPPMPQIFPSSYSQPFYSFYDKETDDLKGKPYGGILTEEQADTTKTLPTAEDRRRFDDAKSKAEQEWRNRLLAMQAEAEVPIKRSKKASGPASQIECIEFGGWEIDTWYAAPYPEEYSRNRVLYICEFCLKYMNSDYVAWRHKLKCPAKHPPGDEIYRHGSISFFEVDGRKNPVYCQNLCLLAKLFLGSKTLYYDVEPFLFYVLCEYDDLGYHFVGYFSKEKRASSQNNVSCILTLPIHQRKGYGHLLIDFSYLLTRVEEKTGSPEKPLSDMGLVSYRNYWRLVLCKYCIDSLPEDKSQRKGLSIRQISDDTGLTPDDAISALEALRFLVRDPITHVYAFRIDLGYCQKEVAKWQSKNHVGLNPHALTWTPYVMGRSNATNFELGPALNTIAPREEDEEAKVVQVLAASGIATGDFAVTNDVGQKAPLDTVPAVLKSTEPNDNTVVEAELEPKTNGFGKENGQSDENAQHDEQAPGENDLPVSDDEDAWLQPYSEIPVTRFQVFPPITSRRPALARLNSSIARPSLPRAPSSASRPRPKTAKRRSTIGTASRKATQKKSSTAKRKTGGTGRGPGRWPKGTKKSDYGNADSGPGLPPAWLQRQLQGGGSEDNETQDTVQVQLEEANGHKGKQTTSRFEIQAASKGSDSGRSASGRRSLSNAFAVDADVVMADNDPAGEEVDAEGYEE